VGAEYRRSGNRRANLNELADTGTVATTVAADADAGRADIRIEFVNRHIECGSRGVITRGVSAQHSSFSGGDIGVAGIASNRIQRGLSCDSRPELDRCITNVITFLINKALGRMTTATPGLIVSATDGGNGGSGCAHMIPCPEDITVVSGGVLVKDYSIGCDVLVRMAGITGFEYASERGHPLGRSTARGVGVAPKVGGGAVAAGTNRWPGCRIGENVSNGCRMQRVSAGINGTDIDTDASGISITVDCAVIEKINGVSDQFKGITSIVGVGTRIVLEQVEVEGRAHHFLAFAGNRCSGGPDIHAVPVFEGGGQVSLIEIGVRFLEEDSLSNSSLLVSSAVAVIPSWQLTQTVVATAVMTPVASFVTTSKECDSVPVM